MKTSIFDMTLTLPPMVEITQVEKEKPSGTNQWHSAQAFTLGVVGVCC